MLRSLLRKLVGLSLLGGLGYGVWRALQARKGEQWHADDTSWPPPPASEAAPAQATASSSPPAADAPAPNGEATSAPPSPAEMPGNGHGAAGEQGASGGRTRSSSERPKTRPARKAPTGKAAEPPGERLWVAASSGGVCPPSHPIKAKLSSKIFHAPGARNYSRTRADRCYPDEQSAVADGLRPALR